MICSEPQWLTPNGGSPGAEPEADWGRAQWFHTVPGVGYRFEP